MFKNLFMKVKNVLKEKKEAGQSLVEYGLILALVSIVAISILTIMGSEINSTLNKITITLKKVTDSINTTGNSST